MYKHPGGRPSIYKDTEEGLQTFIQNTNNFVEALLKTDEEFSMERWAASLGVTRQTLYNYGRRSQLWHKAMINAVIAYTAQKKGI